MGMGITISNSKNDKFERGRKQISRDCSVKSTYIGKARNDAIEKAFFLADCLDDYYNMALKLGLDQTGLNYLEDMLLDIAREIADVIIEFDKKVTNHHCADGIVDLEFSDMDTGREFLDYDEKWLANSMKEMEEKVLDFIVKNNQFDFDTFARNHAEAKAQERERAEALTE